MQIAKAIILVESGSDGSPWPTAPATLRVLFPVANRPILFHCLDRVAAAGITECVLLAAPQDAPAIARAVHQVDWGMAVGIEAAGPAVGLDGALTAAQAFIADDAVLVIRGDAVLRDELDPHLGRLEREGLDALAVRPGGGVLGAPTIAWLLTADAVAILTHRPSIVADPMDRLRARAARVAIDELRGVAATVGGQDQLLAANRHALEAWLPTADVGLAEDCVIQGPVSIHPTARATGATLRGPLVIGADSSVTDCYIGPYTAIGENVVLEGVEIEHSIVLSDAVLRFIGTRLESSVIGHRARVRRSFEPPGAFRLSLGEDSEVVLG